MYDFIQSALTNLIQVIAIAGFGGCLAHYLWTSHTTWMATYCPPVVPYQESEPLGKPQPQSQELPEPEDVWEGAVEPAIQSQCRLEVRHFSPVLALPPAKEQPKKRGRKPGQKNAPKTPTKPRANTRKRKVA